MVSGRLEDTKRRVNEKMGYVLNAAENASRNFTMIIKHLRNDDSNSGNCF